MDPRFRHRTVCVDPLPCAHRELSNLRTQLRSVTRKVELAFEEVAVPQFNEDIDRERVKELLIQVLEALV